MSRIQKTVTDKKSRNNNFLVGFKDDFTLIYNSLGFKFLL
jgi:hypothetical protein